MAGGTQGGMRSGRSEAEEVRSGVYADYSEIESNEAMAGNIKENNLTAFRQYLNDPDSEIWQYLGENGAVYSYNVSFSIYYYDREGSLIASDTDPDEVGASTLSSEPSQVRR